MYINAWGALSCMLCIVFVGVPGAVAGRLVLRRATIRFAEYNKTSTGNPGYQGWLDEAIAILSINYM